MKQQRVRRCIAMVGLAMPLLAAVIVVGGPSTTVGASAAPTGTPLVVGVVSTDTGPTSITSEDVPDAVKIWQNWTNSHGGVAGHPVQVIEKDSKGEASLATSIVDGFVANPNIIAIFDNSPETDSGFAPSLSKSGVPVICMNSSSDNVPCMTTPDFFPTGTSLAADLFAQADVAKLAGAKKIGFVVCSEVAACSTALDVNKGFAQSLGMDPVYSAVASDTLPSYAAQCLAAKAADAQAVMSIVGIGTKFYDDCGAQGYHPIYSLSTTTILPQYLSDPSLENSSGFMGDWPWFVDKTPAQKEFAKAMGSRWPTMKAFTSPETVALVWASLQMFAQAASHEPAHPTRQALYKGIYALGPNYNDGGLIPPETIVKGKPTVSGCFYWVRIQNHKFTTPDGNKAVCAPASDLGVPKGF